jgi:uncharacterized protein YpuA (DUF1002 family)
MVNADEIMTIKQEFRCWHHNYLFKEIKIKDLKTLEQLEKVKKVLMFEHEENKKSLEHVRQMLKDCEGKDLSQSRVGAIEEAEMDYESDIEDIKRKLDQIEQSISDTFLPFLFHSIHLPIFDYLCIYLNMIFSIILMPICSLTMKFTI